MARMTPRVQQGLLYAHDGPQGISVDSPAWFFWLDEHRIFRFMHATGNFTARKERRATGWYWYAYRRKSGLLRNAYLGKGEEVTLSRLNEVANTLNTAPEHYKSALNQHMVLMTKITLPPLSPSIIARPRLDALLRTYATYKVLLVTGPAGSGKTTLLASWLNKAASPVVWISLDHGDNDLARFWSYVIAALQKHFPNFANHMLTLLPTLQPDTLEPFLALLINALATLPTIITLVFDDYHLVTNQSIHESIAFLFEYAPQQVRFIVSSRSLPSLPLPRLRAHSALAELNFADLRFTPQEASTLLTSLLGTLPNDKVVSRLLAETEGWVTGLTLAAQTLDDERRRTYTYSTPQGPSQAVFEYLASEVLARQPAQIRDFLLQTSILEHFNRELCEAVTLQKQSQNLLRHLAQEILFITPIDTQHRWYRYHHLFASALRHRLAQTDSEQMTLLACRAAHWWSSQGRLVEAITYALQARNFLLAAQFIVQQGKDVLMRHEVSMLGTWLRALPEQIIYDHPHLCIYAAWTFLHTSHTDSVERYLSAAEQGLHTALVADDELRALRGEIAAIQARVATYQNHLAQSATLAHHALDLLSKNNHSVRGEAALSLGTASEALGEIDVAREAYREAIEQSKQCGNLRTTMLALRSLAMLYRDEGRLFLARKLYEDGLEYALQMR